MEDKWGHGDVSEIWGGHRHMRGTWGMKGIVGAGTGTCGSAEDIGVRRGHGRWVRDRDMRGDSRSHWQNGANTTGISYMRETFGTLGGGVRGAVAVT